MRILSVAALLVVLGLLGCGGGDGGEDSTQSADESAVKGTLETSSYSDDPATCRQVYTQDFLERMAGGFKGEAALRLCEQALVQGVGAQPREVEVSDVSIEGKEATAEVAFGGGTLDGQTVTVALVVEQGGWRIDRMVEFVGFDRDHLLEGLDQQIDETGNARDGQLQTCILERLEELDV